MDQSSLEALFDATRLAASEREESLLPARTSPHPATPAPPARTSGEPACLPLADFRAAFTASHGARHVAPGQLSLFDLPETEVGYGRRPVRPGPVRPAIPHPPHTLRPDPLPVGRSPTRA